MIEVRLAELESVGVVEAILRPIASDWSAVTPAMRRFERTLDDSVEEQCRRLGELPVGSAAITAAGDLGVDYLVHVVVRSREEPVTSTGVRRGLTNGLRRLAEWEIESVAMPLLGTGAGALDAGRAAAMMVDVVVEHTRSASFPARIVVVADGDYERDAVEQELARVADDGASAHDASSSSAAPAVADPTAAAGAHGPETGAGAGSTPPSTADAATAPLSPDRRTRD